MKRILNFVSAVQILIVQSFQNPELNLIKLWWLEVWETAKMLKVVYYTTKKEGEFSSLNLWEEIC